MNSLNTLYLLPGQLIVTKEFLEISTILGSCISVCLFDPINHVAGINHFIMPSNTQNQPDIEKYGDSSLEAMLNKMIGLGASNRFIVAKVFGGAEMLTYDHSTFNTGQKNIDMAIQFLKANSIKLLTRQVGGKKGRKIIFNTHTGIVIHNYIDGSVFPI